MLQTEIRTWPRSALPGAVLWVAGVVQFYALHLIVQSAWHTPYRWSANNISDLGNLHCQPWGDVPRHVCSPLHALMNASFVVQGAALVLGGLLLWRCWLPSRAARLGQALLLGSGGYVLAGLFPADVNENLHVLGALLLFVLGNLGLLVSAPAFAAGPGRRLGWTGAALGTTGLLATVLFFQGQFLGLGMGGMERLAVAPVQLWALLAGSALLRRAFERRPSPDGRR